MKTQNKYLLLPFIFCLLVLLSCSSDDNDNEVAMMPEPEYSVSDLSETILENPENGTLLGTLSTDLPGTLNFTSSNAAIGFDVASLNVTVADKTAFDYELNTTVIGNLTLSNGTESVTATITITLIDLGDAIEMVLSTSKNAYIAASAGDWIEVTKEEFESLETQIEAISYSGMNEEEFVFENFTTGISLGNNTTLGYTIANSTNATLSEGSYLFAIRFLVGTGIFGISEGNKVKLSETSVTEGYVTIGNALPEKTSEEREVFFVLKKNLIPTVNEGYLALFIAPTNGSARGNFGGSSYFQTGEITEFTRDPLEMITQAYQGLSTTKLQWE